MTGPHDLDGLRRVYLRRRRQDRGVDTGPRERFAKVGRPVGDAVLLRDGLRRLLAAADEAHDFDVLDVLQAVEVLAAESALPDHDDLHFRSPCIIRRLG
jgi:hypothetical protein